MARGLIEPPLYRGPRGAAVSVSNSTQLVIFGPFADGDSIDALAFLLHDPAQFAVASLDVRSFAQSPESAGEFDAGNAVYDGTITIVTTSVPYFSFDMPIRLRANSDVRFIGAKLIETVGSSMSGFCAVEASFFYRGKQVLS